MNVWNICLIFPQKIKLISHCHFNWNSSRQHLNYFFLFFTENRADNSFKLSAFKICSEWVLMCIAFLTQFKCLPKTTLLLRNKKNIGAFWLKKNDKKTFYCPLCVLGKKISRWHFELFSISFFFKKKRLWHFMHNLHEMSKPVLWKNKKISSICCLLNLRWKW